MAKAKAIKEIVAVTPNKVGMLADVTSAISDAGVNIIALSASSMGKNARFLIVTENNQKAMAALKAKKFDVKEWDAISVTLSNQVGAARELAEKLAKAGIDLDYCYGSTGNGSEALLVFSTKDIKKALEICG
jgi:hypothetical protein